MTDRFEAPIRYIDCTDGKPYAVVFAVDVPRLARAEVERFFAWWLDPKNFGGINDPRTVHDYFAGYLRERFGFPEAAPESVKCEWCGESFAGEAALSFHSCSHLTHQPSAECPSVSQGAKCRLPSEHEGFHRGHKSFEIWGDLPAPPSEAPAQKCGEPEPHDMGAIRFCSLPYPHEGPHRFGVAGVRPEASKGTVFIPHIGGGRSINVITADERAFLRALAAERVALDPEHFFDPEAMKRSQAALAAARKVVGE